MTCFLYLCLLLTKKMLVTAKVSRYFNIFLQVLYIICTAHFLERKESWTKGGLVGQSVFVLHFQHLLTPERSQYECMQVGQRIPYLALKSASHQNWHHCDSCGKLQRIFMNEMSQTLPLAFSFWGCLSLRATQVIS